jgi:RNA-directed DNA polymerase
MKDRACKGIGVNGHLQDWSSINWKAVLKHVRNLRQRIYRATQNGQWNKVRSLMKLMLRSFSNLLLSVRRITQENVGKKTAGIDGQVALTPTERVKLTHEMMEHSLGPTAAKLLSAAMHRLKALSSKGFALKTRLPVFEGIEISTKLIQ